MTSRSVKGYRVRQKMVDGELQVTVEKIPGWRQDTSAQIRQRKSKRVRVQSPGFAGLFAAKKGAGE